MKVFRISISVFFLLVVWCLYFAGREFLIEKPIENLSHLPSDATFAMRIDGSGVLKSTLFSVILEANDPQVIDAINFQINEKRKSKGPSKSLGIDYLSDVLVYLAPFENGQILGINYNLKRPDLMRKNAKIALSKNQVFAINDHLGVVLTFQGKTELSPKERVALLQLAEQIAFEPTKGDLADKLGHTEGNKFIQLSSKGQLFGETTLFNRSDLNLSLAEHSLKIDGELLKNRLEKRVFSIPDKNLQPSGLHFYTTLIPEKIQDSIHQLLLTKHLILPRIKSIAINYRGSNIHNSDHGLIYSPDMDFYITFNQETDLRSLLKNSELLDEYRFTWNSDVLDNGVQKYYVQKTDANSYLFSTRKNTKLVTNVPKSLLSLSGDLTSLTKISGDKMILFFLENLPIFNSTKDFFERTTGVQIQISDREENMASIQGQFEFKEEFYPMNEFLKYALQNNFIRVK
ncbi:MAG: hypothetical protein WC044_09005 [Crocinitomicaceae bacterium]